MRSSRFAPARFDEARASLRDEIERLTASWVPDLTLVAVMSTEMIPRIVQEDGPEWAASVLSHLASNIRSGHSQGRTRQRGVCRPTEATQLANTAAAFEVRTCYYEPARHLGSQE